MARREREKKAAELYEEMITELKKEKEEDKKDETKEDDTKEKKVIILENAYLARLASTIKVAIDSI